MLVLNSFHMAWSFHMGLKVLQIYTEYNDTTIVVLYHAFVIPAAKYIFIYSELTPISQHIMFFFRSVKSISHKHTRCAITQWQRPYAKYIPPDKVESLFELAMGNDNKFSRTNSPTAGARTQAELPIGRTSFQLYSVATPNGQKVSILLEELGIGRYLHWLLYST